ncbi:hypothetical protein VTJ04DRAFT_3782 [Mycothermus thermophilus]|uniref:uncharacterized protein n=1 Tax=Humicola insolens TaxID=85995 RepID=UPI0037442BF6
MYSMPLLWSYSRKSCESPLILPQSSPPSSFITAIPSPSHSGCYRQSPLNPSTSFFSCFLRRSFSRRLFTAATPFFRLTSRGNKSLGRPPLQSETT